MDTPDLPNFNLPEKEEKILKAAIKVFSEKGFSASTTNEIAKNAGVSEGTIFRYFRTKKDILRGILIQALNLLGGKVINVGAQKNFHETENKDLRAIFKELIYDRLELTEKIFPIVRVLVSEAIFHKDVLDAVYQDIIVQAMDEFNIFHTKMIECGLLRNDVESAVIFRSLVGNIVMLIAQRMLLGDKFTCMVLGQEADKMIDALLYGIVPAGFTANNIENVPFSKGNQL